MNRNERHVKLRQLAAERPDLMTEAQLSTLVVELARLGGWTHRYHTFISKRSSYGFPDWIFVKNGRLIAAELKSDTGTVKPEQRAWLDALSEVPGVEVYLWRPSDLDEIAETLTGRKVIRKEQAA